MNQWTSIHHAKTWGWPKAKKKKPQILELHLQCSRKEFLGEKWHSDFRTTVLTIPFLNSLFQHLLQSATQFSVPGGKRPLVDTWDRTWRPGRYVLGSVASYYEHFQLGMLCNCSRATKCPLLFESCCMQELNWWDCQKVRGQQLLPEKVRCIFFLETTRCCSTNQVCDST